MLTETAKLMITYGATKLNEALLKAREAKDPSEIIKLLVKYGATDLNPELSWYCKKRNYTITKLLIQHGATNCSTCDGVRKKTHTKLNQST